MPRHFLGGPKVGIMTLDSSSPRLWIEPTWEVAPKQRSLDFFQGYISDTCPENLVSTALRCFQPPDMLKGCLKARCLSILKLDVLEIQSSVLKDTRPTLLQDVLVTCLKKHLPHERLLH